MEKKDPLSSLEIFFNTHTEPLTHSCPFIRDWPRLWERVLLGYKSHRVFMTEDWRYAEDYQNEKKRNHYPTAPRASVATSGPRLQGAHAGVHACMCVFLFLHSLPSATFPLLP